MNPIVFLDTETTSLGPDREPWEIAMIRRDGGRQHSISLFVYPDLSKADPMSLKFSRFYERHPQWDGPDAPWYSETADLPKPWLTKAEIPDPTPCQARRHHAMRIVHEWTRGAFIVGAVPNFDTEMLDRVMREHRLIPAWHYHLRDVEAMAVGYLAGKSLSYAAGLLDGGWKSDDLSHDCGVKPPSDEERHTAMGDADWAMRWYDAIVGSGP